MNTNSWILVALLVAFLAWLFVDLLRDRHRRRRSRRLYFVPGPSTNGTKSALEQLGDEADDMIFLWPPDRR